MKKAEFYVQFLKEEGYFPTIDDDGDVLFKHEGGSYYLLSNEDDARYFALLFPNFWRLESPEEVTKAYKAANDVTRDTKVAKVHVNSKGANVNASVEIYVQDIGDSRHFLTRAVSALQYAVHQFREKMSAAPT
jgi:hypothetical protein